MQAGLFLLPLAVSASAGRPHGASMPGTVQCNSKLLAYDFAAAIMPERSGAGALYARAARCRGCSRHTGGLGPHHAQHQPVEGLLQRFHGDHLAPPPPPPPRCAPVSNATLRLRPQAWPQSRSASASTRRPTPAPAQRQGQGLRPGHRRRRCRRARQSRPAAAQLRCRG